MCNERKRDGPKVERADSRLYGLRVEEKAKARRILARPHSGISSSINLNEWCVVAAWLDEGAAGELYV